MSQRTRCAFSALVTNLRDVRPPEVRVVNPSLLTGVAVVAVRLLLRRRSDDLKSSLHIRASVHWGRCDPIDALQVAEEAGAADGVEHDHAQALDDVREALRDSRRKDGQAVELLGSLEGQVVLDGRVFWVTVNALVVRPAVIRSVGLALAMHRRSSENANETLIDKSVLSPNDKSDVLSAHPGP